MRRKNVYKNRITIEEREEMMAWLSKKNLILVRNGERLAIMVYLYGRLLSMVRLKYVLFETPNFAFSSTGIRQLSDQTSESVWLWDKCGTSTSRLFPGYRSLVYN